MINLRNSWENHEQPGYQKTQVLKKLAKYNQKEIRRDGEIIDLNSKINKLSRSLSIDLTSSFASPVSEKEKIRYFLDVKNEIVKLNDKISKFNPINETAAITKDNALGNCAKFTSLLEDLILYEDHIISVLEGEKDKEFYVKYAEYERGRNRWRTMVFDKLINWNECVKNPMKHPEWSFFLNQMQRHIADKAKIEKMWNLTIAGIERQLILNKDHVNRDSNIYFQELAKMLIHEDLISISPNEYLALWCGGFELSVYVQQSGYTTLEKTKAGEIFDALMLYPDFAPLFYFWNHLSSEFVKQAGETVHVFFRIHDPLSVLQREELTAIQSLGTVEKLIFHPMINKGDTMGVLNIEELSFNQGENTRVILKNFLVKVCQKAMKQDPDAKSLYKANVRAINQMKLD